ncbi:uncharacterized protein LOC107827161 isoform X6 [Nicotiana tabacum]|uniref:Uncharacterized protein LOC107827161 isoform X6 n=1 Tax=Nicotiana tabacum TaxID=4097 RepID=A0AC58TIQ8_TOBAC
MKHALIQSVGFFVCLILFPVLTMLTVRFPTMSMKESLRRGFRRWGRTSCFFVLPYLSLLKGFLYLDSVTCISLSSLWHDQEMLRLQELPD